MKNIYNLNLYCVIQNGKNARQTVYHVHMHIINIDNNCDFDENLNKNYEY